jgi:hypothetical protein
MFFGGMLLINLLSVLFHISTSTTPFGSLKTLNLSSTSKASNKSSAILAYFLTELTSLVLILSFFVTDVFEFSLEF